MGVNQASPRFQTRSVLRPASLTRPAFTSSYPGAFLQYREYGAPREQVDVFVEGVDGSLHRTARLNLTYPMVVSVQEDSSTIPLETDTSVLGLRRYSLEASPVRRQVCLVVYMSLFLQACFSQDESEVDFVVSSLLSSVLTAGATLATGAARTKVGGLHLGVCCVSFLTEFFLPEEGAEPSRRLQGQEGFPEGSRRGGSRPRGPRS